VLYLWVASCNYNIAKYIGFDFKTSCLVKLEYFSCEGTQGKCMLYYEEFLSKLSVHFLDEIFDGDIIQDMYINHG